MKTLEPTDKLAVRTPSCSEYGNSPLCRDHPLITSQFHHMRVYVRNLLACEHTSAIHGTMAHRILQAMVLCSNPPQTPLVTQREEL